MIIKRTYCHVRRRLQAGVSILEAMIGFFVIGVAGIALLGGLTTGIFTMRLARENLRATQIMLGKIEVIRLYTWDQVVNTPGFIPATFTEFYDPHAPTNHQGAVYNGMITISPVGSEVNSTYSNDMRQVVVTINWKTGTLNRSRSFTSYISRNGLQDYIY